MTNLISNRIKFELIIPEEGIKIYCTKSEALFRLKYQYFIENLHEHNSLNKFKEWFNIDDTVDITRQPYVYFDFQQLNSNNSFPFILNELVFNKHFKKQFVKYSLINYFKNRNILVEPYPIGKDLSVYVLSESFNDEWDTYSRYDFIIKPQRNELIFNKTSENVLISHTEKYDSSFSNIDFNNLRAIEPTNQFIKKVKRLEYRPLKVIANNEIKKR